MLATVHGYFYCNLVGNPLGWPPGPAHRFLPAFTPSSHCQTQPRASTFQCSTPTTRAVWLRAAHTALFSVSGCALLCPPGLRPPSPPPPPTCRRAARVGARVPAACQARTCGWRAPAAAAESGEQVSPPPHSSLHCNLASSLCHPSLPEPGSRGRPLTKPRTFSRVLRVSWEQYILMAATPPPPYSTSLRPQLL